MPVRVDHRHLARGLALQVLYELDTTAHELNHVVDSHANTILPADDARASGYMALLCTVDEEQTIIEDDAYVLEDPALILDVAGYQMLRTLVAGVLEAKETLDETIVQYAPEWPLDQLAVIDRNVLRIAIFELQLGKDLPIKVVINEAVELAKLYGSENAPRFVNGVLGAIVDNRENNDELDPPTMEP